MPLFPADGGKHQSLDGNSRESREVEPPANHFLRTLRGKDKGRYFQRRFSDLTNHTGPNSRSAHWLAISSARFTHKSAPTSQTIHSEPP